ncbi:MAG: serine/threonine-protein kinase [Chloroflexota bacterium]
MFDLVNGGQLDRYELRERIGTGGMARVYKAWDTNLERLVAIKLLHEHLADDPMFKQRFEREAKFIASFNHPNIVQVYDYAVIEREGVPLCYMVMSFIPGKTLREALEEAQAKGQRLPRSHVREIVNDLTGALGYAHGRGMVHRDVKPGNVILNERNRAVLTDFGIARMVQSNRLTADGVSTGTPIYMSPEQASGQPGDTRSDLYSLGIIVYEMLTGRPPFVDDTSLAVMLKHLNTVPPHPSEFIGTEQFNDFMRVALAKDPAHRYQTVEEFADAFRATFDGPDHEQTTMLMAALPQPVTPKVTGTYTSVFQTISQVARENPRTSGAIVIAAIGAVVLLLILLANSNTLREAQQPEETAPAPTSVAALPNVSPDDRYFVSHFDNGDPFNANWSTESNNLLTRAFTPEGLYQLHSISPHTAETSIYRTTQVYKNFSVGMMARLEPDSDPSSGYGIVFRYQDENNYNVFAVDGRGRYSIWVRVDGAWAELRGEDDEWQSDENVKPIGEDNGLAVSIIGDFISGYVNDKRVVRVTDGTLGEGAIGMYFATFDGEATVSVESYGVYASVPSMTTGS